MSALPSKWASEETESPSKVVVSRKSKPLASKWADDDAKDSHAPVVSKTSKPLASKWADDETEPSEKTNSRQNPHSNKKYSNKHNNKHSATKHRNIRDRFAAPNGPSGKHYPSPPSTAGHEELEEDKQESEKPELTPAGKDFASRLGLNPGSHSKQGKPHSTKKIPHKQREQKDDEWESEEEEEDKEAGGENEEEPLPPMSDAAQSFASRLGMKPASSGLGGKDNRNDITSRLSRTSLSDEKRPPAKREPKVRYQTPRQRKEELQREEARKKLAEKALHEQQLQEEVKQMFEKLEDKSFNWADLEDE
ncbi:hypothetical protein HYPBUDRAFT_152794 [Hyphopichia burtonii NRRL Y-1933]|uniref:Uncharacterized protein n=1 Tax=Hyphopichia burtonii NRRL Y-1933 TaxID=984485 RepID=A0A1E4RLR2_9ASCO|nr:hypothetical protein HYPBUDRAFT_152794 [Hyphopichia burtonii NRRL Y-1933]ODV68197.1 hypothetical protein HYPBUDRAFT_152794 [Hyphopichia burtonii NRRL Y-1933]